MELAEALVVEDVLGRSSVNKDSPDIAAVDAGSDGDRLLHHNWVGGELLPRECDYLFISFQGGRHMVDLFYIVQPMLELRDRARLLSDSSNHSSGTSIVVIVVVAVWSLVLFCICSVLLQMPLFNELLDGALEGKALFGNMSHIVVERAVSG